MRQYSLVLQSLKTHRQGEEDMPCISTSSSIEWQHVSRRQWPGIVRFISAAYNQEGCSREQAVTRSSLVRALALLHMELQQPSLAVHRASWANSPLHQAAERSQASVVQLKSTEYMAAVTLLLTAWSATSVHVVTLGSQHVLAWSAFGSPCMWHCRAFVEAAFACAKHNSA